MYVYLSHVQITVDYIINWKALICTHTDHLGLSHLRVLVIQQVVFLTSSPRAACFGFTLICFPGGGG